MKCVITVISWKHNANTAHTPVTDPRGAHQAPPPPPHTPLL